MRICDTLEHYKEGPKTQDLFRKWIYYVINATKWQCKVEKSKEKNGMKNTFH